MPRSSTLSRLSNTNSASLISSPSSASSAWIASITAVWPVAPSRLIMSAAALTPPSFAVLSRRRFLRLPLDDAVELLERGLGHLVEPRHAHRDIGLRLPASNSLEHVGGLLARQVREDRRDDLRMLALDDLRDGARLHPLQRVDARRVAAFEDPPEQRAGTALAERIRQHFAQIVVRADADRASCAARRRAARRARPSRARAARRRAPPSRSRASAPLRPPCAAAPTRRFARRASSAGLRHVRCL